MTTIFGAGGGGAAPSVLGGGGGTLSLLDVGKNLGNSSIGLSSSARAGVSEFLNSTRSTGNAMFSAGLSGGGTLEGLQKQILAIRSSKSPDQLAPSLRPVEDENSVPASSDRGTQVDDQV